MNLHTQAKHQFPGGLSLSYHKLDAPIREAQLPQQLIVPLSQHIGQPAKCLVNVGDTVTGGQPLAAADGYVSTPVHAATSGRIVAIEPRPVPHPSGLTAECVVIEVDGEDRQQPDALADGLAMDATSLRNRVRQAGVVGLGGAAFPSFIKLNPGSSVVDTLVINGAECEPYISCDQALMRERADDILRGVELMLHALQAQQCLIGIEDNKPDAIAALTNALEQRQDSRVTIVTVPTRYPQGGEKQLIQTLTGREIPSHGLPLDIGIVCHNPGTAVAVWEAVAHGRPLTQRVVTVTGPGIARPCNLRVRIGTPVSELLAQAGGLVDPDARLIMGGPMMGFALSGADVPVVKATNCILALRPEDLRPDTPALPCIRCGACAEACPAGLLPQQLYWHAKAQEFDKAQDYKLFDCIECGCCAQVCPSHIPLVQYYRHAKTEIWADERAQRKADVARQRHEARLARLEREEAQKKAAREAKKAALRAKAEKKAATEQATDAAAADDPVAAAIARAKAKARSPAQAAEPTPTAAQTNKSGPSDDAQPAERRDSPPGDSA
ncbi:MAG: electron transport complex subunit RsxC [Pseudomonadota bacterium]|nr:electron transport complex subunit RsxC [Pseudomonadota bacterium]